MIFQTEKIGSPSVEATFDTIIEAFLFLDKDGDGKLKKEDVFKALNEASPRERSPRHVYRKRFSTNLKTLVIMQILRYDWFSRL